VKNAAISPLQESNPRLCESGAALQPINLQTPAAEHVYPKMYNYTRNLH
jgi:hypothetical protein